MTWLKMSKREIERVKILDQLSGKKLSRKQAASLLGVSLRQVDRMRLRYRSEGLEGLVHRNRGKVSSNRLSGEKRKEIVRYLKERYEGFGPTLAKEKLEEEKRLKVSKEKLRQIMKEEGLWKPKKRKQKGYHPRRTRRSRFGELLQGDSSHHKWFEERAPRCTLVAFIDDATNKIVARFEPSESAQGYMRLLKRYVEKYGVPGALYVDKHSTFRVNTAEEKGKGGITQFHRLLKELGVDLICANSPQAKGRIERLFELLQDRLVKEMRLRNISSIEEGNKFLDSFEITYEARWSIVPANPEDAHRKAPSSESLNRIFTKRATRKISKTLDFSYAGKTYQILNCKYPYRLMGKMVTILEDLEGKIWFEHAERKLEVALYGSVPKQAIVLDRKELEVRLDKKMPLTSIQRHRRGLGQPR